MIWVDALKMLVSCASVTAVFCEVRSDSVRAMMPILRSTATAEQNSTVPKNAISMIGTTIANSVATTPRQSRQRAIRRSLQKRDNAVVIMMRHLSGAGAPGVWLVLERRGRDEEPLVAIEVGDVVAEPGDEELPRIGDAHDHDGPGAAAGPSVRRRVVARVDERSVHRART